MQAAMQKLHTRRTERLAEAGGEERTAEEGSPIKEPEKNEPEPQKSGGLLKSLFGKK